ncbi:Sec-independent protein translocase protein TatB [Amorphus orientalis]|uniref:Sec-independent protein translocase protein TatB n=1 Tax=Amorphus orientalis TaxID=649198 RepID=A0AAE3VQ43_9HYPH|nr:Sec-independent protein translocase protein TatB [Amorphus orientalis]MDQ0316232.1 sec-independent protein translocase protein TatB [Amorphus orientalis]
MFDIGWTELLVVAAIAILVVGPKELPSMLMTFGRTVGRMRRMANEFQSQFNDVLKEAERQANVDDVRKDIEKAGSVTDPFKSVRHMIDPNAGAKQPGQSDSAKSPASAASADNQAETGQSAATETTETPSSEAADTPPPQPVSTETEATLPATEPQRDAGVGGTQRS